MVIYVASFGSVLGALAGVVRFIAHYLVFIPYQVYQYYGKLREKRQLEIENREKARLRIQYIIEKNQRLVGRL